MTPEKLSAWDVVHAVNLAITTFIAYALTTSVTPLLTQRPAQPVGILRHMMSSAPLKAPTESTGKH